MSLSLSMVLKYTVSQADCWWGYSSKIKLIYTLNGNSSSENVTLLFFSHYSCAFWTKKGRMLYPQQQQIKLSTTHHFQYEPVTAVLKKIDLWIYEGLHPRPTVVRRIRFTTRMPKRFHWFCLQANRKRSEIIWACNPGRANRTERVNAQRSKLRKHHRGAAIWSRANPQAEFIIVSLTNVHLCSLFLG